MVRVDSELCCKAEIRVGDERTSSEPRKLKQPSPNNVNGV